MSGDRSIQLPPDSSGKAFHLVETDLIDPTTGSIVTAYQEVVSIADEDGNLIAVTNQGRPRLLVTSPHQIDLMEDILSALKEIQAILIQGLSVEGTWVNAFPHDPGSLDH